MVGMLLGGSRLVSITGAPGIGKTRLALEVGARVDEAFPDGVWVVDLAPVRADGSVLQAVATVLGVREVPGADLLDTLTGFVNDRHLLVVLDSCEHVIGPCAGLAERLLRSAPRVTLLCTSREPLAMAGERLFTLGPLGTGDPKRGSTHDEQPQPEAVALFVERARAADPTFSLSAERASAVTEICRRTDGIPLAIELVAARVPTLSLGEIGTQLDEGLAVLAGNDRAAVGRHRSMQLALDWSHELLGAAERALLRRLSVFTGGCDADAAAGVCSGGPLDVEAVADHLASLVAKSLVVADTRGPETRYSLLETVRVYGAGHLRAAGEAEEWAERHGRWYVALAERADPGLTGAEQLDWLGRLDAEHDNLRSALGWALSEGRADEALQLAGGVVVFWRLRGYWTEGRQWLEAALELGEAALPALRSRVLWGAGFLALMLGDLGEARLLLQQSLELADEGGDNAQRARCLLLMANVIQEDDPPGALALLQGAVSAARGSEDAWCLSHALGLIGLIHKEGGEPAAARSALEDCVSVARRAKELQGLRLGLSVMGELYLSRSDLQQAKRALEETLGLSRRLGEPYGIASALGLLGRVALREDELERAQEYLNEASTLARGVGSPSLLLSSLQALAELAHFRRDPGTARRLLTEVIQIQGQIGQASAAPLAALARVERAEGNLADARRLYDAAVAAAREHGTTQMLPIALTGRAEVARVEGEARLAGVLQGEALEIAQQLGDSFQVALYLEAMGALATDAARFEPAARLFGAADGLRHSSVGGGCYCPAELEAVRAALGPEGFEVAWAAGKSLSPAEAVSYACRRMPASGRPSEGWASLTRIERDVVALVTDGLTDAEIGERLFISPRTVSNHLSRIYARLPVASRRELTSLARQNARPDSQIE